MTSKVVNEPLRQSAFASSTKLLLLLLPCYTLTGLPYCPKRKAI